MIRIANPLCLAAAAAVLSGCGNLTVDYAGPASGPQSTVRVTATYQAVNSKVLVHGADVCDFSQAKVAAILTNWDSALVAKKEALFRVPPNQEIAISMPATVLQSAKWLAGAQTEFTSVVTQPVVRLRPDPGATYEVSFSEYNATVYKLASGEAGAARTSALDVVLDKSCKFSTKNLGNDRAPFYLFPRDGK